MNLRLFFTRDRVTNFSRLSRLISSSTSVARADASTFPLSDPRRSANASPFVHGTEMPVFQKPFFRCSHTSHQATIDDSSNYSKLESENEAITNEFLSRFVWIMRKKLKEAYPDCGKSTIDGMLVIIVENVIPEMEKGGLEQLIKPSLTPPSDDFSEDLWRTVWEVSNVVLQDMAKEKKKEKMKSFLQSEEVKEMYRFAGEIGVRGDLLRELRFKWARKQMEKNEFYERWERRCKEEADRIKSQKEVGLNKESDGGVGDDMNVDEEKENGISLPKRHGKIKYKIYGLNLSDPKWTEVADKIHESSELIWPEEAKPITGKCKLVAEKILSLEEDADPAPLLAEWVDLFQPSRIDWIAFLNRLKEQNPPLHFKIAELLLGEESFQTNICDYSKLIEAYAKEDRLQDAERILKEMEENGIAPDVITSTIVIHMYCKSGNIDKANEAFVNLRTHGFQPDLKVYNSMIMAHVSIGKPGQAESLMREMETRNINPTKDIYMALLRSFSQKGDANGAQRIHTTMQFAGFQPDLESCTLMIESYVQTNDSSQARTSFDHMIKSGLKPDDRCVASIIAAHEKQNELDKALNLLMDLEKDGFEPGVATYTNLVDWLAKLELIDEAEQLIGKIAESGEAPPFKLQISLCTMYAKAGSEKKALQALGVLESKIEQLGLDDFKRIIESLIAGGFTQDARRIHGLMEVRGFVVPEEIKVALMTAQALRKSNIAGNKSWLGRDKWPDRLNLHTNK